MSPTNRKIWQNDHRFLHKKWEFFVTLFSLELLQYFYLFLNKINTYLYLLHFITSFFCHPIQEKWAQKTNAIIGIKLPKLKIFGSGNYQPEKIKHFSNLQNYYRNISTSLRPAK